MKTTKKIKSLYKGKKTTGAILVEVLKRLEANKDQLAEVEPKLQNYKKELSTKQSYTYKETLERLEGINNEIKFLHSALEYQIESCKTKFMLGAIFATLLTLNLTFILIKLL